MKWDAMIHYERQDAKIEGKIEGKIEDVFELLSEHGEIPEQLREKILQEENIDKVKEWVKLAAKVNSVEEFIEKMK